VVNLKSAHAALEAALIEVSRRVRINEERKRCGQTRPAMAQQGSAAESGSSGLAW
jgi:hypothetical protein